MTSTEHVILVDIDDNPVGIAEKILAHKQSLCHRAFSVFICRQSIPKGTLEILLQQRAQTKYHSPNLWTNTCCSHPRPGEDTLLAAQRRLEEEMGIRTPLQSIGSFHYIAHFENGLVENEVDHVLIGFVDNTVTIYPNPKEVQQIRWITITELEKELEQDPSQFTPWLKQALECVQSRPDPAKGNP